MLIFYLWAIGIGQLAFVGNYHWLATMLLSLSSLAVNFTEWVKMGHLYSQFITDMHTA